MLLHAETRHRKFLGGVFGADGNRGWEEDVEHVERKSHDCVLTVRRLQAREKVTSGQ